MKTIKFKYDKETDKTVIHVKDNGRLIDTLEVNGQTTRYTRNRIRKSLLK